MPAFELGDLRSSLDNIDSALILLLNERFRLTAKIGAIKRELELPAVDPEREAEIFAHISALAAEIGLDVDFSQRVFRLIVDEAARRHMTLGATKC